jgi:hypothetical protein
MRTASSFQVCDAAAVELMLKACKCLHTTITAA